MKIQVKYLPEDDIVLTEVEGEITVEMARQAVAESIKEGAKHGTNLILGDLRGTYMGASTIDIYELPRILKRDGVGAKHINALVVAQDLQDHAFMETVADNQALSIRFFTRMDEAKAWLKKNAP
ncbi:STAS/SEC14 domain-containing protein [Candidatus Zixiibacteriota bacterium]